VLVVIDSLGLGGAERVLVTFARGAKAGGIELQVASISSAADSRDEMLPALRSVGIEPQFLGIPRLLSARAIPRLAKAIRASGCDLVHAHLEYAATLATPAAALVGRPTVCTFHHVPQELPWRDDLRERLAVAVSSFSKQTIFVSKASRDEFARRYRGARRSTSVVPNGIDLDAFSPDPATFPPEFGIDAAERVVVVPAALRPMKGHDTLLRAWPGVLAAEPAARLVFAGSGSEEASLRALAATLGLGDAVVFAGFREDMPRLLRAADLVVLPTETEALPTALIEAAASGRAAVASNVGGVPEVLVDGVTGILVEPRDVEGLSAAIQGLLSDEVRLREMGEAARAHALKHFGVDVWVQALRRVYENAIGPRRR